MTMQTDIHILGLGDVGGHLYRDLLISTGHVDEIGNVYAYVSGGVTRQCNLTQLLHEANRFKDGISDALRSSLEQQQRTVVWQYDSLDALMGVLSQHAITARVSGRRNILVAARNYQMDYFEDSAAPPSLPSAFLTTFGADADWEKQRAQWQQIQQLAEKYAEASLSSYMTFIREVHGASFCDKIEPQIREIVIGKKANRASGSSVIGIQQLARAMAQQREHGSVDSLMDLVFMISNPVDITTIVYAAETGRVPSTVLCPQDNDRLRYLKHARSVLNEFIRDEEVCVIGPHNHWNMVVPELLLFYFHGKGYSMQQVQQHLEEMTVHVNQLVVENFRILHQTPSDYYDVLHQAIVDALRDRTAKPTKIIQWSPDDRMYIGWMGRLQAGRVIPCKYEDVFPVGVSEATVQRWHAANNTIKAFLDDLMQCNFLSQSQIDALHRKSDEAVQNELNEIYARTPTTIFVQRNPSPFSPLLAGDYLVTAWHQLIDKNHVLHFAVMRSEQGAFTIERDLCVKGNVTPRHVVCHNGELYYSHRSGIDAVNMNTSESQRILSLDSQHTTGVTSFVVDGSSILFSASGKGIGRYNLATQEISWEYETTEHVDALQQYGSQYIALCGDGIVKQTAAGWEKFSLTKTPLEALVAGEKLFALGRTDTGIVIIDGLSSCTVTHNFLQGDAGDIRDAIKYKRRLKAGVQDSKIVAVTYDGQGVVYDSATQEAQLVSTELREVVGVQSHSHGFLISGLDKETGYLGSRNLRLPYCTVDKVNGLGTVPNIVLYVGEIHIR